MTGKTIIFYDSEFTGLHQRTTLISMALCAESGEEFYAEFSDYDAGQCDAWIRDNVLAHTRWLLQGQTAPLLDVENTTTFCRGDKAFVRRHLDAWLARFAAVEICGDCLAYDWVLFCELYGGALSLPNNVFYMPQDLVTLFRLKGYDPDTPRAGFSGLTAQTEILTSHNALWDARAIKACYGKLMTVR